MSEVKKIVELKEEELDKVNGGSVSMDYDLTKHYDIVPSEDGESFENDSSAHKAYSTLE